MNGDGEVCVTQHYYPGNLVVEGLTPVEALANDLRGLLRGADEFGALEDLDFDKTVEVTITVRNRDVPPLLPPQPGGEYEVRATESWRTVWPQDPEAAE